jgi:hypothetical protein
MLLVVILPSGIFWWLVPGFRWFSEHFESAWKLVVFVWSFVFLGYFAFLHMPGALEELNESTRASFWFGVLLLLAYVGLAVGVLLLFLSPAEFLDGLVAEWVLAFAFCTLDFFLKWKYRIGAERISKELVVLKAAPTPDQARIAEIEARHKMYVVRRGDIQSLLMLIDGPTLVGFTVLLCYASLAKLLGQDVRQFAVGAGALSFIVVNSIVLLWYGREAYRDAV